MIVAALLLAPKSGKGLGVDGSGVSFAVSPPKSCQGRIGRPGRIHFHEDLPTHKNPCLNTPKHSILPSVGL